MNFLSRPATLGLPATMPAIVLTAMPAAGQTPMQSALVPASAQAAGIALLWWAMLIGACVIFALVMAILVLGLWRARRTGEQRLGRIASRNLVVVAGVAIPLAVLIALVGGSLLTGRALSTPPEDAITIEVIGWRWWWEVRYLDAAGELIATTANEIHVPVDRPVRFRLRSADVIHSFWVPNLHGKTDLLPGHVNESWFEAGRAGVFRGQCAEFCGTQHAMMGFLVVAEAPAVFDAWLAAQRRPAREPQSREERLGYAVFQQSCASCHRIRAEPSPSDHTEERLAARRADQPPAPREPGIHAPDLTHFGSRRTLAAAVRPSTRGHIAGWIADPQGIKPGSFMPATKLEPNEFMALVSYLQSLK